MKNLEQNFFERTKAAFKKVNADVGKFLYEASENTEIGGKVEFAGKSYKLIYKSIHREECGDIASCRWTLKTSKKHFFTSPLYRTVNFDVRLFAGIASKFEKR